MSGSFKARSTLVAVCAAASLAAVGTPASADPAGSCPPFYELFQIPADGSRPVAEDVDARGNADGFACQKPFSDTAAEHAGAPYNVIDNRVAG